MTNAELILHLQTLPQEAIVIYSCCSETTMMEQEQVHTYEACAPRADGWVQNERLDMPKQTYIYFPGN